MKYYYKEKNLSGFFQWIVMEEINVNLNVAELIDFENIFSESIFEMMNVYKKHWKKIVPNKALIFEFHLVLME